MAHCSSPAKSDLAEVALQCICTLAADVTHFNFSINLMDSIVTHLSKKSWDKVTQPVSITMNGSNGSNDHSHQKCV